MTLKEILLYIIRYTMNSIKTIEEYEEYKEKLRNMTDEQIEQHIGLERRRNIMDGYPENHGIEHLKILVKELREENESDKFITGETHDELLCNYLKEKCISIETEMNQKDFSEWLDKRAIECLIKEFPNTTEKRIRKLYTMIENKNQINTHTNTKTSKTVKYLGYNST